MIWPGILLFIFVICYLIGSISFSRLAARVLQPGAKLDDVTISFGEQDESFKVTSVGGNTLGMKFGARAGCLASIMDIFKVFIPTLAVRWLFPEQSYFLVAATAGFIGHCWPVYYRFKGGRGVSAFYGGLFAFDPLGALITATAGMVLGLTIFRRVQGLNIFIMYCGGVILILPWFWITKDTPEYLIYGVVINFLFFLAMIPDIRQSIQLVRKYGWKNVNIGIEQYPMGRSMVKIMNLGRKPGHEPGFEPAGITTAETPSETPVE